MGSAYSLTLTFDVLDELSDLAVDELGYIIDAVREQHAGARADLVEMELRRFQRVRHLEPAVVHSLAEAISGEGRRHATADGCPGW
jgi:hypothetical protein